MTAKPELEAIDFFTGLVCAIRAFIDPSHYDFYDRKTDVAAVAVFDHLSQAEVFDLQFYMRLHEVHGDSPVWRSMVSRGLGLSFTRRTPGGPCDLRVDEGELEQLLHDGSIPGTLEQWKQCAEIFRSSYANA